MSQRVRDMTAGSPARLILTFALPLMLGNVFQQFYTMTDAAIVGQFLGVEALAALGEVDWLHWMLSSTVQGLTTGFGILLAQRFGAGDIKGLRNAEAMGLLVLLAVSPVLVAVSAALAGPVLRWMHTPENIFGGARTYLITYCFGLVFIAAHNYLASMLRALGNSKTPLMAMVIGAVFNIAADLFAIQVLHWGVFGAALATVLAQLVSALVCLWAVCRIDELRLSKENFVMNWPLIGKMLKLAMPVSFQFIIISVGGLMVQAVVNKLGFLYVAGFTATNKLFGMLEIAALSFGSAMATYGGQNLGAGRIDRIRQGIRGGMLMGSLVALCITALSLIFGRQFLLLFIAGDAEQVAQVLDVAYLFLSIMAGFLITLYWLHIYRSMLQGLGDTLMPMLSGVAELIMRVIAAVFFPKWFGPTGIFWAEMAAWIGADLLLIPACYWRIAKLGRSAVPIDPAQTETGL